LTLKRAGKFFLDFSQTTTNYYNSRNCKEAILNRIYKLQNRLFLTKAQTMPFAHRLLVGRYGLLLLLLLSLIVCCRHCPSLSAAGCGSFVNLIIKYFVGRKQGMNK
jgi:hypothetical protein